MKLCMIGTGYVGLVSGVCFSDLGNEVICVDKDSNKVENFGRAVPKKRTSHKIRDKKRNADRSRNQSRR